MLSIINELPRISLGQYPTPLVEAPRLSTVLGGPRIYIKRDDLNGLAIGGNKCRKLEFALAQAEKDGATAVISTASSQSNWCLQLAAAARKRDIKPAFVLLTGEHTELQGNLLLHNILDSVVKIIDLADMSQRSGPLVTNAMEEIADELRGEGYNPCILPTGKPTAPSAVAGAAGWINAADELITQLHENKIDPGYVILANGGGGTQAGFELGSRYLNAGYKTIGVSILSSTKKAKSSVIEACDAIVDFLNLNMNIGEDDLDIPDSYIGEGYGIPTREGIDAIRLVAQTEGIFLDPVYTGKAMAGLIDMIKTGRLSPTDTVVFIHTGGTPALFAYNKELSR